MEKKARLIFAQIDDVSGEVTGFAIGKIMELGANNVQLIPTITKKNRPGNIIIIDIDAGHEEDIAKFLARELKVSGYHRINTDHIFQQVTFVKKNLTIRVNGKTESFQCEAKLIGDPLRPLTVDIEHDFLVRIQEVLNTRSNFHVSLNELRTIIESRLRESDDAITIEI
ncbi:MAG: hypothetical protein OHK0032_01730 [Thermodesulfovibrionales bacterium]